MEIKLLALKIQGVVQKGFKTYWEATDAIEKCLNSYTIGKEGEEGIVDKIYAMGIESLPPEEFEQLENIIKILRDNRKALKRKLEVSPYYINLEALEELRKALESNAAPLDYRYALTQIDKVSVSADLLLRLTEEINLCDTCNKEFYNCKAKRVFAVDLYPKRKGKEADIVLECSTYEEKEKLCPICESPLEDNGACQDLGSNNCQYQA